MSPQKVGMDTLDELADKEKFFRVNHLPLFEPRSEKTGLRGF